MKRLIALLVAAIFCIALFSPPVTATCPDPSKGLPWMDRGEKPNGDGGGWNDIDSEGSNVIVELFDTFKLYGFKFFIIYFIPNKIDNNGAIERDVSSNDTDIPTSRVASTR